ncbi:MAG: hypothetical protein Q8O62_14705 [Aequorivita sp.]|nr:hypothetical protein [Aequorivita sp.]
MGYDYSRDNLYFVTICVRDMVCCFGEIVAVETGTGTEADRSRDRTGRDLSVRGFESNQIMILNVYGEIVRDKLLWLAVQYPYVVMHNFVVMPNHVHAILEIDSLRIQGESVKIKSLSSLVGAFKTTASKRIHEVGFLDFSWHRSFHDHIIRNEISFLTISNYIDENPRKWKADTFFRKI